MSPREWANVRIRRPEVKRESVFLTVLPDVPRAEDQRASQMNSHAAISTIYPFQAMGFQSGSIASFAG